MKEALRLVYVIGTYPSMSITFIDREIKILREWGVNLQILAVRRPVAGMPLSADQEALKEGVIYLLPVRWLSLVFSHFYFGFSRPLRYFKTLFYLLTRPHPRGKARYLNFRFMTFLHFAEAVYGAYLLLGKEFQELHGHFVERAATIALVISRLLDKPYSLSIHAGPDIFVNPIMLREKIMEARHVACCTAYNKAHVESIVGQDLSYKISCIHHGLDLTRYQPNPIASNESSRILSVAQLFERKGLVHLIEACRLLKDRGYDFTCHILGDGPQRFELENLLRKLSLENVVILHGSVPHEEVIENYRQATMSVLPCVKANDGDMDGFPNVLAEAMAMQVPVISTNVSAVPELIKDGVNGLLVPPADNHALSAAMGKLLNDPALRVKLGQNGRQSVLDSFDAHCNIRRFATTLWPDWFQE